jgi:hypothetical protein
MLTLGFFWCCCTTAPALQLLCTSSAPAQSPLPNQHLLRTSEPPVICTSAPQHCIHLSTTSISHICDTVPAAPVPAPHSALCTSVPPLYLLCTSSAPPVHLFSTSTPPYYLLSAPPLHLCTSAHLHLKVSAPALHICASSPALHLLHTFTVAPALHLHNHLC